MVGNVTLTASMRANLYSLQQTTQLMGTIQGRLATGKKVNSALDNPNNYFSAQNLTNRASDLSNLLDGMGQAIQAITTASNSVTSAQKMIDQMKAVANSAIQAATAGAAGSSQPVVPNGPVDTTALATANGTVAAGKATAASTTFDSIHLLTNLNNGTTGISLGIKVGDTLTMAGQVGAAHTATFTVTATSTLKDLQTFMQSSSTVAAVGVITGINAAIDTTGQMVVSATGGVGGTNDVTLAGNVATALGINGTAVANNGVAAGGTGGVDTGKVLSFGPVLVPDAITSATGDMEHRLTGLTDGNGASLGIANGDKLTYQLGTGQTLTFTVGAAKANPAAGVNLAGADGGGTTLNDLQAWLKLQGTTGALTLSSTLAGKLIVTNQDTAKALVLGGNLAATLGVSGSIANSSGGTVAVTGTTKIYAAEQSVVPQANASTLLRDLSSANGAVLTDGNGTTGALTANALQTGSTVTVQSTSLGLMTINVTDGMTVQNLLDKINAVDSKLKVSLDTSGRMVVDNQTANSVTFGGTGGAQLFNTNASSPTPVATNSAGAPTTINVNLYAGFGPKAGTGASGTPAAASAAQFDTLRTQLDQLVNDSSYQGINLISGTGNSPLTVTFDEKATDAASLVINAVDLTSNGLSIKAATGSAAGAWGTVSDVQAALSTLTTASTTLRTHSATLGTNLSTVQTRQDFTNNMIATLKAGSDSLTLADMNEESANMLALQTRSQLGTQALSLANQANQSVMRLFQ